MKTSRKKIYRDIGWVALLTLSNSRQVSTSHYVYYIYTYYIYIYIYKYVFNTNFLFIFIELAFDDGNLPGGHFAMTCARNLVGHFKSSTQSLEKLLDAQRVNGVKIPLCVIQDIVTRWWSTFSMCERLVVLKLYIMLLVGNNPQIPLVTESQWKIIETQVAVLQPFMTIQKMIEGQKYVNISLIPYLVCKVRDHLDANILTYSADVIFAPVVELLTKMQVDFNIRWGSGITGTVFREHQGEGLRRRRIGLPLLTMQAALLDPRTKAGVGLGGPQDEDKVVFVQFYSSN